MNLGKFVLFLKNIDGVGEAAIRKLIICNCFKNLDLKSSEDVLSFLKSHIDYFTRKQAIESLDMASLKKADNRRLLLEQSCANGKVTILTYFDEGYPNRFKRMKEARSRDFPLILFCKGNIGLLGAEKTCAIIGTRKPSEKAKKVAFELSKKMTERGYVIISGLADGCDTLAHKGCLEASGKTVAILGMGLDKISSKAGRELANEILSKDGLIISEYPLGTAPQSFTFVQRDRLQAALGDLVIPVQTSESGGTMHACNSCETNYGNRLVVVSPNLVDDGETSGNRRLIETYFAKTIDDLSDSALDDVL